MTAHERSGRIAGPPSTTAADPRPPVATVAALCVDMYYADLVPAYAFVFHVTDTRTVFTVYASTGDSYRLGTPYRVLVAPADSVPLPLTVADVEFLRHCLHNAAGRWREVITEADAGATRPQQPALAEPGYLNVEPTPAGYRSAGRLFTEELDRVEHLGRLIDQHLEHARPADGDGGQP
jgi:hypothetical protein